MRLLIVSHPPLAPDSGAAQTALSLAAALRRRGHDVVAWSPEPLPAEARWWNRWRWQRRRLEEYLASAPRFEAIDLPAVSISRRVAAAAPTIARSVQPDLRYFAQALTERLGRLPRGAARSAAHTAADAAVCGAILAGWRRAHTILCLGSLELEWMRARLPWTRRKLVRYVGAAAPADQAALAAVRTRRAPPAGPGRRFLWIGRWVPHKGTRRLAAWIAERAALAPHDTFTLAGCGPGAAGELPRGLVANGRLRVVESFRRAELPALLAAHDAGVFTSEVEGWGLSLHEMLESGLPVFATPAGGVPDLAPFFPHSLRPFPPALAPAPTQPLEDLEANGYHGHFGWEAVAAAYEMDVLSRLAPGARGRSLKRRLDFLLTRTPGRYADLLALRRSPDVNKRAFLELVRAGDVVFDVGANLGYYTLLFSHLVGGRGEVHAFEPLPATAERLRAAVAADGRFANVRVRPLALGEAAGEATLYLPGDDHGQAALVPHRTGSWRPGVVTPFPCRSATVDGYVEANPVARLDFLKCDVEGAELPVLRGAVRTLARFSPLLHLELSAGWSADFGYGPADVLGFLSEQGYVGRLLVRRGDDAAARRALEESEGSVDLLAWRPERHAARIPLWIRSLPDSAQRAVA